MEDITSARIRALRIALGMTQEDLAFKCGYKSRVSINKIELNARNVTLDKLKVIADALHTTPAYLMGWEDEAPKQETITELTELFDRLPDDKKETFMSMLRFLSESSSTQ